MAEIILRGENIHKWFGSVHALNGVDFQLRESEILGLIGGNGAGKSTLIKILSGVYRKDDGKILLRGQEVDFSSPSQARAAGIETVYQDMALVEDLNVSQNIFLTREITKILGIVDNNAMRAESSRLVKSLGLSLGSLDKEVRYFSGGERQGIALSRAIYFKARMVFLDEPTTALSHEGRKTVFRIMQKMREEGISFIIISHDIERIYELCDRFLVFSRGEKRAERAKEETTIRDIEELLAF